MFRVTGQGPVAYRAGERSCGEQVPRLGQVDLLDTGSLQFYAKVPCWWIQRSMGVRKRSRLSHSTASGGHIKEYTGQVKMCAPSRQVSPQTQGVGGEGADAIVE